MYRKGLTFECAYGRAFLLPQFHVLFALCVLEYFDGCLFDLFAGWQ